MPLWTGHSRWVYTLARKTLPGCFHGYGGVKLASTCKQSWYVYLSIYAVTTAAIDVFLTELQRRCRLAPASSPLVTRLILAQLLSNLPTEDFLHLFAVCTNHSAFCWASLEFVHTYLSLIIIIIISIW